MTIRNGQNLTWLLLLLGGGVFFPCDPELYERWASGCWRRKADGGGGCDTARREDACFVVVEEIGRLKVKADRYWCCCFEAGPRGVVLRSSWRQAWRPEEAVAAIVAVFQGVALDLHDDAGCCCSRLAVSQGVIAVASLLRQQL
jgi:hypothetical protein